MSTARKQKPEPRKAQAASPMRGCSLKGSRDASQRRSGRSQEKTAVDREETVEAKLGSPPSSAMRRTAKEAEQVPASARHPRLAGFRLRGMAARQLSAWPNTSLGASDAWRQTDLLAQPGAKRSGKRPVFTDVIHGFSNDALKDVLSTTPTCGGEALNNDAFAEKVDCATHVDDGNTDTRRGGDGDDCAFGGDTNATNRFKLATNVKPLSVTGHSEIVAKRRHNSLGTGVWRPPSAPAGIIPIRNKRSIGVDVAEHGIVHEHVSTEVEAIALQTDMEPEPSAMWDGEQRPSCNGIQRTVITKRCFEGSVNLACWQHMDRKKDLEGGGSPGTTYTAHLRHRFPGVLESSLLGGDDCCRATGSSGRRPRRQHPLRSSSQRGHDLGVATPFR
eukprot:TRINITY_DN21780_c0_g1_i2.p1 TRINITY_DN21780_c0_g1~~TRINITY_DN21780_c0_g1_i2.p1  ORF type:complete len:422 (+),score=83.36 TRINITY_DN21780_c0_g1_i2:101-1267(+)